MRCTNRHNSYDKKARIKQRSRTARKLKLSRDTLSRPSKNICDNSPYLLRRLLQTSCDEEVISILVRSLQAWHLTIRGSNVTNQSKRQGKQGATSDTVPALHSNSQASRDGFYSKIAPLSSVTQICAPLHQDTLTSGPSLTIVPVCVSGIGLPYRPLNKVS